jgi:hypothetical protein
MRRAIGGPGLLFVTGLAVAGSAGSARAQAAPDPSVPAAPAARAELDRTALQGAMRGYFYGEKWQGPWFMGAGVVSIGAGAALVAQDSDFMRGTSYPLFAVGTIQLIAGAVIFFRSDGSSPACRAASRTTRPSTAAAKIAASAWSMAASCAASAASTSSSSSSPCSSP